VRHIPKAKPAKKLTKNALVRSLPSTMTAKDVIAKGKAVRLELTEKSVHAIRYELKAAAKKKAQAKKTTKTKTVSAKAPTSTPTGVEDLRRAAASEIALSRAISILQEQQNVVRAVLGA